MKNKFIKYSSLIFFLFIHNLVLMAQESKVKIREPDAFNWILNHIILLMGAATVFGAVWAVVYLNSKILQIQKIKLLKKHGIEVLEEIKLLDKDPWWKQMYDRSWSFVPVEKEKDILLNHNYDGIQELDNVLPPWWVAMFWGCLIYGFAYLGYYHVWDIGQGSREEYVAEMEYAEAQIAKFISKQVDQVDESNVAIITDERKLNLAEATYLAYCATCHGKQGEGGIGPNMTDKYWIHGGHVNDIFKTIKYGVPSKGMVPWKSQLRPSDMQNLASYILTLQGTNPPNGKEPQGELYEPNQEIGMK